MASLELVDVMRILRDQSRAIDLWRLLARYYAEHGVTRLSYHLYRGPGDAGRDGDEAVRVIAQGFPDGWTCRYIEKRLYKVDPIPALARSHPAPFLWSRVGDLARLSTEEKAYLSDMAEAGVGEGLAIHVHGPAMRNAYVGLGFETEPATVPAAQVTEFQCVAQMGHLRFCELHPEPGAQRFDLAPREREVLHWMARGKSNAAIASILGLSPHTVDTLVRRLFDKLGVTDRTTAALRGVGAGLILPH